MKKLLMWAVGVPLLVGGMVMMTFGLDGHGITSQVVAQAEGAH